MCKMGPYDTKNIPPAWKERLRAHLKETTGDDRDSLGASDFGLNSHIHLRFPDGSFALFRSAFCIVANDDKDVMVFTERCGYHIFSAQDLLIETMQGTWAGLE